MAAAPHGTYEHTADDVIKALKSGMAIAPCDEEIIREYVNTLPQALIIDTFRVVRSSYVFEDLSDMVSRCGPFLDYERYDDETLREAVLCADSPTAVEHFAHTLAYMANGEGDCERAWENANFLEGVIREVWGPSGYAREVVIKPWEMWHVAEAIDGIELGECEDEGEDDDDEWDDDATVCEREAGQELELK